MRYVVLLLAVMNAGCVGMLRSSRENTKMESWLGHDVHEVISSWGPPTNSFPNGSTVIYEWRWVGASHAVAYGNTATAWTNSCREWFDVNQQDRIVGWHWQGYC